MPFFVARFRTPLSPNGTPLQHRAFTVQPAGHNVQCENRVLMGPRGSCGIHAQF